MAQLYLRGVVHAAYSMVSRRSGIDPTGMMKCLQLPFPTIFPPLVKVERPRLHDLFRSSKCLCRSMRTSYLRGIFQNLQDRPSLDMSSPDHTRSIHQQHQAYRSIVLAQSADGSRALQSPSRATLEREPPLAVVRRLRTDLISLFLIQTSPRGTSDPHLVDAPLYFLPSVLL